MKINITQFFQAQQAIKIHHWVTDDYALHVLLDDFLKDYNKLVDDIVENILSVDNFELEIDDISPNDGAFIQLDILLALVEESFLVIQENIDIMPKGMRTIIDEVKQFVSKYRYLFSKFGNGQ